MADVRRHFLSFFQHPALYNLHSKTGNWTIADWTRLFASSPFIARSNGAKYWSSRRSHDRLRFPSNDDDKRNIFMVGAKQDMHHKRS